MIQVDFIQELPDGSISVSYRDDKIAKIASVDRGRYFKVQRFGSFRGLEYGQYSGLSNISFSYKSMKTNLVMNFLGTLVVFPKSWLVSLVAEIAFLVRILFNWNIVKVHQAIKDKKIIKACAFIIEAVATIPFSIILRLTYQIARLKKSPVWLITDRGMAARDSGEALFKYIQGVGNDSINVYFVLSKKSSDYIRMQKIGPVVSSGSFKHKLLILLASKLISSHADIETTNPFFRIRNRFADLLDFDFIFLQHGVIRHDHSEWLNKYEKNIKLFITSADKEYESILNLPYGYTKKEVLLSGLPRFDYLENNTQRKVVIAPTYRANLLKKKTDKRGIRPYDPMFKRSSYFKFYNELINDDRLLNILNDRGYSIDFLIHPNFEQQRGDFNLNKYITIPKYPYEYAKFISEGALLVSDYSSITLDFAYLLKPVIYAKFDEDVFYKTHSYSRSVFFDDESDGFGVVTKNKEELVDEIIRTIEGDCKMEEKYKLRVKSFFHYMDKSNSKRVYDAIIKL